MRPAEITLLGYARSARGSLVAAVVFGSLQSALAVAQAWLLASAIATVFVDAEPFTFFDTETATSIRGQVVLLAAVVAVRALLTYASQVFAARSAANAKSQLRVQAMERVLSVGPGPNSTEVLARGLDGLDVYFGRYFPRLVTAAVAPLIVGTAILAQDAAAGVIVAVTLPVIAVSWLLIELRTAVLIDRHRQTLSRSSRFFVDLLQGLPTLKVFGRAQAQARLLVDAGDQYRDSALKVLRVAHLSTLVLGLLAPLAFAVIVVSLSLRLVKGDLDVQTGLFILLLVPEVFMPLRRLGEREDLGPVVSAVAWLDEPLPAEVGVRLSAVGGPLTMHGVSVFGGERAVLRDIDAEFPAGQLTAVVGPPGAGKSLVLGVLLGFDRPATGTVRAAGIDVSTLHRPWWFSQVSWVPQHPLARPGTVADNVRLGCPQATDQQIAAALLAAGIGGAEPGVGGEPVHDMPGDRTLLEVPIGEPGTERWTESATLVYRVAVARALVRNTPVLLLDEPPAALDEISEAALLATLMRLRDQGRTIVVVTGSRTVIAAADSVVDLPLRREREASAAATMPGLAR